MLLMGSLHWVANIHQASSTLQDMESSHTKCGPESDPDVSIAAVAELYHPQIVV
jgi:hypothetical protein